MHLSLDDFNLLISQKADPAERVRMMDHILECEMCATRFRMLNELDQRMDKDLHAGQRHRNPFARMPLKYALGAAAVLVMAIYPYFTNPDEVTEPKSTAEMASHNFDTFEQEYRASMSGINILEGVRKVNYQHAVKSWGQETTILDLLKSR